MMVESGLSSLSVKVLLAEKRNIEVEKHLAKREWCCGASLSVESMLVEKRLASIHVRTCTSLRENYMAHISPLPSRRTDMDHISPQSL